MSCSEASCRSSGCKSRQQRGPATAVVISSVGEGDRTAGSLDVKVPDGWETSRMTFTCSFGADQARGARPMRRGNIGVSDVAPVN
jgi:hypothetical protein